MDILTQFSPITPQSGLIGFITFTIENLVVLSGIAVFQKRNYNNNNNRFRLSYPTRKTGGNTYKVFYPHNHNFAKELEKKANNEINKYLEGWNDHVSN